MLCLLGEVTARVDGRAVDLGPARQRCILAALALDAGRVVPRDRLVERVWGGQAPRRARGTLHSYISRLRRVLAPCGGVAIVRRSGGYVLTADTGEPVVDLHLFRALCARARAGDDAGAARLLTEALELWRGEALTGVAGEWAEAERDRLGRERLAAQHDLVDARLRLGQGEDLVVELAQRAAEHPLDERVAGQHMLALHQAGRVADALERYRQVRARLVDELGVDPGAALQDLHRRVLTADPALGPTPAGAARGSPPPAGPQSEDPLPDGPAPGGPVLGGPAPGSPAPVPTPPEPVVPRQLPAPSAPFVGRRTELDRLDATVGTSGTVVISAIAGAGGIGKTWLALHWAHRNADRFPDGQLFVDLRGFSPDGRPMDPSAAVRGFLDALGADPGRIPVDPHAQAALFRSLVTGKRMLFVLDNAADTAQVTPLLPGGESCAVVVTSRNRLPGLITGHAAHHLPLDVLTDAEARALLTDRLGGARVAAEPAAVDELIGLCGGFPLALSIVAGHAHTRPDLSLAALAAELRDLGLDALDDDDPTASLPAVLSWSHHALTPVQATTFALLATAPGADIGLHAAASLAGLPLNETRAVLRGLERASLVGQDARGRYRMHDLIRRYAADTARCLADQVRESALRRVVDSYLHTAHAGERLLDPHHQPADLDPPEPGAHLRPLPSAPAALVWFDAEHANLLAAQRAATAHRRHRIAWQFAWALTTFHTRRGHRDDQLAVWRAALEAAEHLPDPAHRVHARRLFGLAHADLGCHEVAIGHLHRALALAEHHHDRTQQAHTHQALARAWERREDHRRALEHATRALHFFRTLDQPVWEADALNQVGWYAALLGDHDTARRHCRAALALQRHHRNPNGEAATLDSLGYIDHHTAHHDRAVLHYRQALDLYRRLGHTYQAANTLEDLGHPYAALGRRRQAREVWLEALELYRQQGRDEAADRVLRQLAAHERARGDQPTGSAK
ncbi:BTAD domain-containing putative transcriptional regulator [Catellatospora bangladeshensis]